MDTKTDHIYDQWLILRCQTGDRHAIEMLASRWQAALLQFATIVTRDRDLAHDAIQETWVSVIRNVARLQDTASYKPWLFRIAHNKCIDVLRRRGDVREARDDDRPSRDQVQLLEDSKTVDMILGRLTEEHRAVLALHYLYDMEIAEIADLLGIPCGTVKSRLYNGREAFRRALVIGGEDHERPGPENRTGPRGRHRLSWHY